MLRSCLLLYLCFACVHVTGFAKELYRTDFDAFPTGQGAWVGTEGWATAGSTNAFGISNSALPDLGNTAYIGFHRPASTFNFVFRNFALDPLGTDHPIIRIETIIGVQDSTNGQRDQFFIGIRNRAGAFLAGIGLDNRDASGSGVNPITRLDGVGQFSTLETFDRDELHILYLEIDYAANTWSAELDGLFTIFKDAPFTNSGNNLDFGFLSYEWQLSAGDAAQYGNNFMLVGDLIVDAVPVGTSPFVLDIDRASGLESTLSWLAEPGFQYEIETASGPGEKFVPMPGMLYRDISSAQRLKHVETSAFFFRRVYRIRRSVQP